MAANKSPVPLGPASYKIRVVGAQTAWFRDAHHAFLRMSWWMGLLVLIAFFLLTNVLFAFAYAYLGGVANARAGSVIDGFYFSVQTMATIGYGYMYPQSTAAHALVVTEAVLGLLLTALCAGLVFAKFSQPTGRIAFSREVVIGPMDGVPTLMFRVGNERGNQIVEATIRVAIVRTVRTSEGQVFYRMTDLPLVRDRSPAMTRSWNVMHSISDGSPLHGYDPERMAREEVELIVSLVGVDDTSYQPVHARHQYEHQHIIWGARHADVLSEAGNGDLVMDVRNFHLVVPTEPLPSFPYPRPKTPA
jgi:inward rectifier potassium channel